MSILDRQIIQDTYFAHTLVEKSNKRKANFQQVETFEKYRCFLHDMLPTLLHTAYAFAKEIVAET